MKYRDPKKKSNISTKFSNEFQFPIIISSFCGFDELVELKIHNWVFIVGLASHIDFCGLAGIRTFFYVKSVGILLIVKSHGFIAFVWISANIV